ncbi:LppX_LprAFG lipoprotein [Mycolicibacterium sp.]|uniref:LppX_LprAFG lipoprotein n=1 Tax=Mycolicibacterium sp. TaxID=2320850 RepID=UPI0037C6EABA
MKVGIRAAVAATVAAALMLTACGTDSKTDSTSAGNGTEGGGDAAALVQQSADAMKQVTGFHLELTAEGKVPNLKVTKVVGDVSNKPAPVATGTATIQMGHDKTQDAQIVFVDGHLYSDVAEPGKWTDYGEGSSIYNPTVLLDGGKGLATLLSNLKDAKNEGTETINGVEATKVSATSTSKDVLVLAGSNMAPEKSVDLPTTVWIANDGSHHLLKAQMSAPQDSTVTLTLSDFNKEVTATKPV